MSLHVLHLLGTADAAGASIAAVPAMLARRLDRDRFRIHACFLGEDGPLLRELQAAGVEVRSARWAPPYDLAGAARFWSAVRMQPYDLVHQHFGGRSVRWMARRTTGAPLIMHLHGRVMESQPGAMVLMDLSDVDAVIVNSAATAACVQGIRPEVIYPGVALPATPAGVARSQSVVLGAAGRLVPLKGFAVLLDAVARLVPEFPELRVEIAGSGPEEPALREQIARLGLQGTVRLLGWCDDLPARMAEWQLYCQPSLEEAAGVGMLQAMAAGLPVVASSVGGVPEVVHDGVTGHMTPPGDAAALAERLRNLVAHAERRVQMGSAARQRVREHFSEELMVSRIEALYRQVVDRRAE
jgi:glycosyltransferase involved in cell wall biosynthesis